jgi:hypothetical protein
VRLKPRLSASPGPGICASPTFPPQCGFRFMLSCKIKAREIKRLPLAQANSAFSSWSQWGWGGVGSEPPPGPSPSFWQPNPLGSRGLGHPLGLSSGSSRVGGELRWPSGCYCGLQWVLRVCSSPPSSARTVLERQTWAPPPRPSKQSGGMLGEGWHLSFKAL